MTTVGEVILKKKSYLQDNFTIDKALLNKLEGEELLSSEYKKKISKEIDAGQDSDALTALLEYIEKFYLIETLKKFCTCLSDNSSRKPKWNEVAMKILNAIPSDEGPLDSEEVSEEDSEQECEHVGTSDTDEEGSMPKFKKPRNSDISAMVKDGIKDGVQQTLAALLQGTKGQGHKPNTSEVTKSRKGKHKKGYPSNESDKGSKRESGTSTCKTLVEVKPTWKCLEWTLLPPLPESILCKSAAATKDALYVILEPSLYKYLLGTCKWIKLETPPDSPMFGSALAVTKEMDLHYIGGKRQGPMALKDSYCLKDKTKTKWEKMAPLNSARHNFAALGYDTIIVVAGGRNGSKILNTVEVMNIDRPQPAWYEVVQLPCRMINPYISCNKEEVFIGLGHALADAPNQLIFAYSKEEFIKASNKGISEIPFYSHRKLSKVDYEGAALVSLAEPIIIGGVEDLQYGFSPYRNHDKCKTVEGSLVSYLNYCRSEARVTCNKENIFVVGGVYIEKDYEGTRHVVTTVEKGEIK